MCLCTDVVAILEEQPGCVTLLNESPMVRRCRVRAGSEKIIQAMLTFMLGSPRYY